MTPAQRSLLLLLPSLSGLLLILFHSWRQRGPKITIAFFVSGAVYGLLRDAFIQDAMIDDRDLRMPYEFALPVLRIGDASIQAVVGWLFSIYASWCIAEAIVRRFEPQQAEPRLFPVLTLACLTNAALGYAVEVAAAAAGWWWWNLSVKNPFTLDVPVAGVIAWFSVPFDFLLPFLLIFGDRGRIRWWALVTVALFPLHIKWSHGSLELGYQTLKIPLFTTYHLLMILSLFLGSVIIPIRTRGSGTGDRWAAAALVITVVGITGFMQTTHGDSLVLLLSLLPLVVLSLVAFTRFPTWAIGVVAAVPATAAVAQVGAIGFWAWVPAAYLIFFERTVRPGAAPHLKNAHAMGAIVAIGAAYLFCANGNGNEVRANRRYAQAQQARSLDETEKGIRQAIELCPHKDEFHFALARLLLQEGDRTGAIAVYRDLAARIPGAELAHVHLGNTLVLEAEPLPLGSPERRALLQEARERFDWAVKVRPEHPQTHFALGRFLATVPRSIEKQREGVSHLERAIALASVEVDNEIAQRVIAQSWRLLAQFHERANESERAIEALEELKKHRARDEEPELDAWIDRLRGHG